MARPVERFVETLTDEQQAQLKRLWKTHPVHRTRCRAHAVLLSSQRTPIAQLAEIFDVTRQTVSRWLAAWEDQGTDGLEDDDKPGRTPILDESQRQLVTDLLDEFPRQPDRVLEAIKRRTGKSIARRTLERLARAAGYTWKRMRRVVKRPAGLSEAEHFQQKSLAKEEIAEFLEQKAAGEIDVYFYDETNVSLTPTVPYGWQPIGQTREIPSAKGGSVNVMGFMTPGGELAPYLVEGSIDSEVVEMVFDDFASRLERPAVIIWDNAPVHTSQKIAHRLADWAAEGLTVYPLPAYSPELNLIERLWKELKHSWLPLEAYHSLDTLKEKLTEVLRQVGDTFTIQFAISD